MSDQYCVEETIRRMEKLVNDMGDIGDQEGVLAAAQDLLTKLAQGQVATSDLIMGICKEQCLQGNTAETAVKLLVMLSTVKDAADTLKTAVEKHLQETRRAALYF